MTYDPLAVTYDPLAVIAAESAAFSAAAEGDLDAPVPSCPDWQLRDLITHLGMVHRFHALHVVRGVTDPPDDRPSAPETDEGLREWFSEGTEVLLNALTALPPDAPAWNWAPHTPQVVSFWHRRMALETAVHRWDAERVTGSPGPFDPSVALDGIDEVLAVHLPADRAEEPGTGQGVVQVRVPHRSWNVELTPHSAALTQTSPEAVLAGTASEVFLFLWGRWPLDRLQVEGDPELVAALPTG